MTTCETVIEQVTREKIVSITCDICGKNSKEWNSHLNYYEKDDVTISHRRGYQYPEGGSGEELDLDICPKCFEDKVLPFFKSLGVKADYKDWEW